MLHKDLRDFLDYLRTKGELAQITEPVDSKYEVAAYIRKSSDLQGPAFLFNSVNDSTYRMAGGIFCSPSKAIHALKSDSHEMALDRFSHGLENVQMIETDFQYVCMQGCAIPVG